MCAMSVGKIFGESTWVVRVPFRVLFARVPRPLGLLKGDPILENSVHHSGGCSRHSSRLSDAEAARDPCQVKVGSRVLGIRIYELFAGPIYGFVFGSAIWDLGPRGLRHTGPRVQSE